ncbi:MlaD family protein [Flavobacterium sp. NRK F10]|uniref:MCE family protein n=1 Tax=Flavobacterium sediminis TaxID=2201181 RepID=A0A2U8QXI8_9FLAO|nr:MULTISPECIES: MlaD family protein [Flavobacterium]AWM14927.1 MCE family protein [Flavobacterium sediminis]MCO6176188.1 MlaD family protein [Flavobacterium sp. NRK F10]
MKLSREIKTAILVISAILLFIWGYNFLKGKNLFDTSKKLYVVYDSVEGLEPSSSIRLKGVTVGRVNSYEFLENRKVVVEMSITSNYPISKSSVAELRGTSPLGGKEIIIVANDQDPELAESGDYLKASSKLGLTDALAKQIEPLKDKIERLLDNANVLFANFNEVLDDKTKSNLKNSIAELNKTMTQFSSASKSLNQLLAENKMKLNSTVSNLDKTTANFAVLSDSLSKAHLGETVKNLEKTLANVDKLMNDMEQGKGTMGKLMKDETLYTNFTKTSKELELLLQDLRLHPTRYINVSVFGKKNKPYEAPEVNENNEQINNK